MAADECIVFYSWASDHPNNTNRSLIERALRKAVKAIHTGGTIQVEPVIDRDTQGVPGSPDIAATIFDKIDHAQVFVCDVTIVDPNAQRPAPNPNVLLELGFAVKRHGFEHIVMVMNTAFGKPELLPFDLRMRRVTTYHKPEGSNDQGEARKLLEGALTEALRTILEGLDRPLSGEVIQPRSPAQIAQEAIEADKPNRADSVRRYMESLGEQVAALTPKRVDEDPGHWDEQLFEAINSSSESALEFTRLAESAVTHGALDAIDSLYDGFSNILELYNNPRGFSGPFQHSEFDLPKFVGHELFVTLCAFLIRSSRWELLADLLNRDLYVSNADHGQPDTLSFTALSEFVLLLDSRKRRLQSRQRLLHADLLDTRHTGTGVLARALPMDLFTAADYFLYLRGELRPAEPPKRIPWLPWSVVYLRHPPRFLLESVQIRVAQPLARALGLDDIDRLRTRFLRRAGALGSFFGDPFWHDPVEDFPAEKIGTR